MSMRELLADMLEAVVGGQQASGCTVTNRMEVPVILYHPRAGSISTIAPGQPGTVPAGRFAVISQAPNGGLRDAECQPGGSFSVIRDERFDWKRQPALRPE